MSLSQNVYGSTELLFLCETKMFMTLLRIPSLLWSKSVICIIGIVSREENETTKGYVGQATDDTEGVGPGQGVQAGGGFVLGGTAIDDYSKRDKEGCNAENKSTDDLRY